MPVANVIDRIVEPEWLDRLPAQDCRAAGSRADLRRVNRLMGHARTVAVAIQSQLGQSSWQLAELGAGDGSFAFSVVRQFAPEMRPQSVALVDRIPVIETDTVRAFAKLGIEASPVRADVFDWLRSAPPTSVLFANLFLHHFASAQLRELFTLAEERCTTFVACEPRRSQLAYYATKLLRLIGCNEVTRHDSVISVRAGFSGSELTQLWPNTGQWHIAEGSAGLFSHLFTGYRPSNWHPEIQS